jgi:hypothetical protein
MLEHPLGSSRCLRLSASTAVCPTVRYNSFNILIDTSTPLTFNGTSSVSTTSTQRHDRTTPAMNSNETQVPLNGCPDSVRVHAPDPAQRLQAKRKPKLSNEGRDLCEDRKRTKQHSTIPGSRKKSGDSASKTTCLYGHPTINPDYMTTASLQGFPVDPRKPRASSVTAHMAPKAPAATSTKLLFPPPLLLLSNATKTNSTHTLPPCRRSSYERRHGGPQFAIFEDSTATNRLFFFESGYPFFPWDLDASARARNGTDNTERDQENDAARAQDVPTPGSPDRHAPRLVVKESRTSSLETGFRCPEDDEVRASLGKMMGMVNLLSHVER